MGEIVSYIIIKGNHNVGFKDDEASSVVSYINIKDNHNF